MNKRMMLVILAGAFIVCCFIKFTVCHITGSNPAGLHLQAGIKPEYTIFIEIEDKRLYLLKNGTCDKSYAISSGMSNLPSPIGSWKIIRKGEWGEGFGGWWMGLNVPWGTFQDIIPLPCFSLHSMTMLF